MSIRVVSCVLASAYLLSGCANTGTPIASPPIPGNTASVTRGAMSGEPQELDFHTFVKPDCTSEGEARIIVASPPKHGRFDVISGSKVPAFPKDNIRNVCNNAAIPATRTLYTSDPGFVGDDSISYDVLGPNGSVHRLTTLIHVYGPGVSVGNPPPVPGGIKNNTRGARSGERQEVGMVLYVTPNCSTEGDPKIILSSPPKHGIVEFRRGSKFPEFKNDNIRYVCNTVNLPATLLDYTSSTGYVGLDDFSITRISPGGEISFSRYVIQVL